MHEPIDPEPGRMPVPGPPKCERIRRSKCGTRKSRSCIYISRGNGLLLADYEENSSAVKLLTERIPGRQTPASGRAPTDEECAPRRKSPKATLTSGRTEADIQPTSRRGPMRVQGLFHTCLFAAHAGPGQQAL